MKITVSIICPIRNEEKYIGRCLDSLVRQTYDRSAIEILVVDGMSDDRTRDIVREYQSRFPNIRLLDNPRKIVPCALNIGIAAASGRYILRMDGHASAAPDYVEQCVTALDFYGVDCVGGPIVSVNESATGKAIALAMSSPFGVGNSRFRTSNKRECLVDTLAFPAFKRAVFSRCGLFDEELVRCQDDEFNFRLRKFGGKILLTPKIKSCYYPRASFRKLWNQYFGYGFWKVRVLQKNFWQMQPRHFVPAAFVASLICGFSMSLLFPKLLPAMLFALVLYLLASGAAAAMVSRKNRGISPIKILLSFYILHFSYGGGFLWGLIKFARRWFHKKNFEPAMIAETELASQ
jgi:glycosyltransferase involved in cell wall biosynthesis